MNSGDMSGFLPPKEDEIDRYRILREKSDSPDRRWLLLIKELRVTHGCSILEAERIALADERLRRWVQKSINARQKCRKQALAHIRYNGADSLIEREGESFKFRIPPVTGISASK
ncbi:hypothetical protein [Alteriqipengyuania lutimaris]|uniref:hypothetical protein n=1 Tax=Alteriqipengyuania lutimaris TaxID=1538146 RepID=UPI001CFD0C46|nr:hypothetical protein [Alteriqipengyuania lutimaris]